MNVLILWLFLVIPPSALAGWFSPDNYDDCILDSMVNINNATAAKFAARSCRNKFPNQNTTITSAKRQKTKIIDPFAHLIKKKHDSLEKDKWNVDKSATMKLGLEMLIRDNSLGLLKGEKKKLFDEAVKRGIIILPKG